MLVAKAYMYLECLSDHNTHNVKLRSLRCFGIENLMKNTGRGLDILFGWELGRFEKNATSRDIQF